jgi:hypothetical protein
MEKVTDTENLDRHRESEGKLRGTIEKLMGTEKVNNKVPLGSRVSLERGCSHACIPALC